MTAGELKRKLARSSEAEFVHRLNMLIAAKPDHGHIKNTDPDVRWKGMDLNVQDVDRDGTFIGNASGYLNLDSDEETVCPGAFDDSLQPWNNPNPVVLWQHKFDMPVGWHLGPGPGDPQKGLPVKAQIFGDCDAGNHALAFLRGAQRTKGARAGLSVGFLVQKKTKLDGKHIRGGVPGKQYTAFERCSLMEYSVVSFPANPESWVTSVKSQPPLTQAESSASNLSFKQHLEAFSVLYDAAKVSETTWERTKNAAIFNQSLSLGQQLEMIDLAYRAKRSALQNAQANRTLDELVAQVQELARRVA